MKLGRSGGGQGVKEYEKTLVRRSEERTIKKQGSGRQKMAIGFVFNFF